MSKKALAVLNKDHVLLMIFTKGVFCGELSGLDITHSRTEFNKLRGN